MVSDLLWQATSCIQNAIFLTHLPQALAFTRSSLFASKAFSHIQIGGNATTYSMYTQSNLNRTHLQPSGLTLGLPSPFRVCPITSDDIGSSLVPGHSRPYSVRSLIGKHRHLNP